MQVSYVLDTEDVFSRARKASQQPGGLHQEARNQKFEEWLSARHQQILQQQQVQQAAAAQQAQAPRNPMAPILEATAA